MIRWLLEKLYVLILAVGLLLWIIVNMTPQATPTRVQMHGQWHVIQMTVVVSHAPPLRLSPHP